MNDMVPGQIALLVGAIVAALILAVMGILSYRSSKKELLLQARRKEREEAHRKIEQAQQEETEQPMEEQLLFFEQPAQPEPKPAVAEQPRSTRNDFDFKF